MDEDVRTILSKLGLRSCDGVGQKLTKMIANMTDEQVQNKVKTQDVTKIIEAAQQISDMPTPNDDQQWEDFYWNVVFTDDVNQEKVLDKDKGIKARMLEMDFFKKMGVYKERSRSGSIRTRATEATGRDWLAERSSVTRGKICSRLRRLWRFSRSSSRTVRRTSVLTSRRDLVSSTSVGPTSTKNARERCISRFQTRTGNQVTKGE